MPLPLPLPTKIPRLVVAVAAAAMVAAVAACASRRAPLYAARLDTAAVTALGRELFFDPALSASGRLSCASCHDPRHAFGPPPDLALALQRAVPSLRYLQTLPPFSEHHYDNDGDDSVDAGPTGGHTWDGRAASAHDQARLPLLSPQEMGNASPAAVVARLKANAAGERLRAVFGSDVLADDGRAFDAVLLALEVFQQSPAVFYPYSSRYDEFLRGRATLSAAETRGLALFDDPAKGNCAACHLSRPTADGAFPLFTDFGFIALGVPRSAAADPSFHDLGLCGPLRTDLADRADYCGLFRTPTLRNVALKRRYFHNGAVAGLDAAVRFYARRDSDPAAFYPRDAVGRVRKFDDLPPARHANVNVEPPFGQAPGDAPPLDDGEVADIVAFLRTLTDADVLPR